MTKIRLILVSLLLLAPLLLSACTTLYPEIAWRVARVKEQIATDTILVSPLINEQRPGVELGFVAYMNVEKAQEMEAPTGREFVELLAERVVRKERLLGHKICHHGYKIGRREPSISNGGDWKGVWSMGFDCNQNAGGTQS